MSGLTAIRKHFEIFFLSFFFPLVSIEANILRWNISDTERVAGKYIYSIRIKEKKKREKYPKDAGVV